jgi:hypothetical protein
VFVQAGAHGEFHLFLVDVAVFVADGRWHQVVRQMHCFGERDHLRSQSLDCAGHCLLEIVKSASCEEASVESGGAILDQDVEGKDLDEQFKVLLDLRIVDLKLGDCSPEDVELHKEQVCSAHHDSCLGKEFIVFHLG